MKTQPSLRYFTALLLLTQLISGCGAGRQAYNRGLKAEMMKDYDRAMTEYRAALDQSPGHLEYEMKFEQARFAAAFAHFHSGRRALENGDLETALKEFTTAIEIDPTHALAVQERDRVTQMIAVKTRDQVELPRSLVELKAANRVDPRLDQLLQPTLTGPISLRMTQEGRVAFETLADLAGLNIIFDPDFRSSRIPIELENVDLYEALEILSLQTRSFWKPVNRNTILISPDNQQKRREYEDHIIKTIYLSNSVTATEITEAITALRTLLSMRYIVQSTTMNAIIVKDTADRVAIAEKIIDDIDKSKPEVLVEAMVLEVDRNRLRELGIALPTSTNLGFIPPGAGAVAAPAQGQQAAAPARDVRLTDLDAINAGNFTLNIPDTVARFLASDTNTRMLQNPRVRASDGKLAQIRIGSRVPVASGSFQPAFVGATGTPVVQFQYIDVGVNLDITPRVLLNREISMTVIVQVQAVAGDKIISGVALPVFTNRSITHEIRLKEGETNILGGIITDTDSVAISGIPGLSQIPIIKYLFTRENRTRDQTEIIILLRPHIVRMPNITELNLRGLEVGTEANVRLPIRRPAPPAPAEEPGAPPAQPAAPAALPAPSSPAAPPSVPGAEVQPAAPALTFAPTPAALLPGRDTPIDLTLDGTDIAGVELTLVFDPAHLLLREFKEGGLLSKDGQPVALVQRIETSSGTARLTLERPPNAPTISGAGALLQMVVQPLKSGESRIRVTEFKIRNSRQQTVTANATEVVITVP